MSRFFPRVESGLGRPSRIDLRSTSGKSGFSVDVRLIGPLWLPGIFESVVNEAIDATLPIGMKLIQSRTPVDTGNLRSQWEITKRSIINDEYYASFVEYGTIFFDGYFMATDSVEEIEELFKQNIVKAINRRIGLGRFFS